MSCPEFQNVCPPIPEPVEDDDYSYAAQLMEALGGKVNCYKDKSVSKSGGMGQYGPINVSGSQTRYNDITFGCQAIQTVAQTYKVAQRNISCVLNQSCNKQINTVNANQLINIKCKEIIGGNMSQFMNIRLVAQFSLTDDEVNLINNAVKDVSKQLSEIVQNTSSGHFKGDEGQRLAQELKVKIEQTDYKAQIKQSIVEFNNALDAGQVIDITGKKRCIFNDITQTLQIDMFASSIINTALKNEFGSLFETINEQETKAIQKTQKSESQTITYIVIAVVTLLVIIVLGIIIYKISSKKADMYMMNG